MREKIYTVGNKVSIPEASMCCKHTNGQQIIFVGKMNYEPNVVAVCYFAKHIFPSLTALFDGLRFIIVGAHPNAAVRGLESEHIEVTGFVDFVEPYFQNATLVVAPMLTGAGIQNKIIQAMSYGCCVVTTPIGAEGLIILHDEIAIYDCDETWIKGVSSLLKDRKLRIKMGQSARTYVKNNLSYEHIEKQFWRFMDEK